MAEVAEADKEAQVGQKRPRSMPVNLDVETNIDEGTSPAKLKAPVGPSAVKAKASGAGTTSRKYYLKDAVRDMQEKADARAEKADKRMDKLVNLLGMYIKH